MSIETPVRATSESGVVPDGFAVRYCDVTANPRKAALDLRHVVNASVERNDVRQQDGAMAVRLGDSTAPGCVDVVFRRVNVFGGFVHAKAQSSGLFDSVEFFGLDPLKHYPVQFDGASKVLPSRCVAWVNGPVPANAHALSAGVEWRQRQ